MERVLGRWPAGKVVLPLAGYCGLLLLVCYITTRLGLAFTICPLKNFTGLPCPFCGGTRAALALLQGHLRAAFLLNPLAAAFCLITPPALAVQYWLSTRGINLKLPKVLCLPAAAMVALNWAYLIYAGR